MGRTGRIVGLIVVVAAAAAVAYVVLTKVRETEAEANALVDDFEAQLAAMDPLTRGAAMARLSADGVKQMQQMRTAQNN